MAGPAERQIGQLQQRFMQSGEATLGQGVSMVQGFGPERMQSMFDVATRTNFMPALRQLQARASRTGQRGPVMGALEGDLASAFQRNISSVLAGHEMDRARTLIDVGGTQRAQGLELLGLQHELELAREQARQQRRQQLMGAFGSIAGSVAGSFLGPIGAQVGGAIGGRLTTKLFPGNNAERPQ
jgi:hypothetical protein